MEETEALQKFLDPTDILRHCSFRVEFYCVQFYAQKPATQRRNIDHGFAFWISRSMAYRNLFIWFFALLARRFDYYASDQ